MQAYKQNRGRTKAHIRKADIFFNQIGQKVNLQKDELLQISSNLSFQQLKLENYHH